MRSAPLASRIFALIGALLLAAAVILGLLGSFAYLAVAAVGLVFVAAALFAQATISSAARVPAVLGFVGMMLALFGTVTTAPFPYLGLGLVVCAGGIALLLARRRSA